jgi:ribosome-associated translation inhibitor RaiA
MAHSEALAILIRKRAEDLERFCDRVVSCHVVVELAGHHRRHGDRFRVTINLGLPGHELVVNHEPSKEQDLESADAVTHKAFDEAARQLEDWVKRRRSGRHEDAHRST